MKFWLIDMEKEFSSLYLSKFIIFIGMMGYFAMVVFIFLFFQKREKVFIDDSLMAICFCGIFVLLSLATYCKIGKAINDNSINPSLPPQNDIENLSSSGNLPEIEGIKKKFEIKNFANVNPKKQTCQILFGISLTIFTLITHSFVYFYIISCDIPRNYHLIFMVNIAFPVTLCLVIFTIISANIFYNLWVDGEFVSDYLKNGEFVKILVRVYVILGCIFILFAFIAAIFSSFCGMVNGDYYSEIVFILFICIVCIPFLAKILKKLIVKLFKEINDKNK